MNNNKTFIEVAHYQTCKYNQRAAGDVFLSQKDQDDGRVIITLSDGLGSGVKANVLASLTATMATKFVAQDIPIKKAAEIIMNTLPVCQERGISYATFTLVDIEDNHTVRIVEYDNPPYILVREKTAVEPIKDVSAFERKDKSTAPKVEAILHYSQYVARPGDRLIFFSDGVTQAGMGSREFPFGWGEENVQNFLLEKIIQDPQISARELAKLLVTEAWYHDGCKAKDDITCGVIYSRSPRDLLVMTGPPMRKENDDEIAEIFSAFEGKKVICGGTTANILSRELKKPIKVILKNPDPHVPPASEMEGADLVTEGIITLGKVSKLLENGEVKRERENAVTKLLDLLLDSDRIQFVVGTKINEAHQDPNMPVELEIRRNVIKKIAQVLEKKYLKEVNIQFF